MARNVRFAATIITVFALSGVQACSSDDNPSATGGSGSSGAAGVAGESGSGGMGASQGATAGTSGTSGTAGSGGTGATAGTDGTGAVGASGGTGGTGGESGTGGSTSSVTVQILAINDFHGNIDPPTGSSGVIIAPLTDPISQLPGATPNPDGVTAKVPAGGVTYLATHIAQLRAENPNTLVVSAGDLTGASPLVSGLFHDEPTIHAMNAIGLDYNGVGNHEFDHGLTELLRLQNGGCAPEGCMGMPTFPGASFQYLAANVEDSSTLMTIFPAYEVREIGGVKIAIVGMTLRNTPDVTVSDGVAGLAFESEAQSVNSLVPEITALGASAIVVLLHQGGVQSAEGTYDSCTNLAQGGLAPILAALDPAVNVVVSAHTHDAYNCTIGDRLVTSAESYGRLVTKIELSFDTNGTLIDKAAKNVAITRDVQEDSTVKAIVDTYHTQADPLANAVVGYINEDIVRTPAASCESPLGDVIADAMLAATYNPSADGAVAAFMNFGGIRADLLVSGPNKPAGAVTYGELFAVQPFSNFIVTMDLSGADIVAALQNPTLQVAGISYSYSGVAFPQVDTSSVIINGQPIDVNATYRIATNNFVAGGGDGYTSFTNGTNLVTHSIDIDALVNYFGQFSSMAMPLSSPTLDRVTGNACQ